MYLDPGFGGMLVQIIVALVAAGGAILFALRKRIKNLFSKNKATGKGASVSAVSTRSADEMDTIDMLDDNK